MKTKLFNFILVGTLLVTGVVSAQENFATPIHTGGFEQKKSGSFVAKFLKAGLKAFPAGVTPTLVTGSLIADKVISSRQGFFTTVVLPVNNRGDQSLEPQFRVGTKSDDLLNAAFDNRAPVTVDLVDRNTNEAVALLADPTVCTPNVSVISTNTSAFQFYSDENLRPSGNKGDNADLIARQIRLSGGSPTSGSILISVDKQGTATWGKVRVDASGKATYEYNAPSPVIAGLCETPNNPPLFCSNIPTWTQQNLPSGPNEVTWTGGNGNACIPSSCNKDLIGKNNQTHGVTVEDRGDCPKPPEEGEWDIVYRAFDNNINPALRKPNSTKFKIAGTLESINLFTEKITAKPNTTPTCEVYFNQKYRYPLDTTYRVAEYDDHHSNWNDRRYSDYKEFSKNSPLGVFRDNMLDATGVTNDGMNPPRKFKHLLMQALRIAGAPNDSNRWIALWSETNEYKAGTHVTPNTPTKWESAPGNCLYQAQIWTGVKVSGNTPTLTRPQTNPNGTLNESYGKIAYGDYYQSDCKVLPVGQKPPTNEKWTVLSTAGTVNMTTDGLRAYGRANAAGGEYKVWVPAASCSQLEIQKENSIAHTTNKDVRVYYTLRKTYQLQFKNKFFDEMYDTAQKIRDAFNR